MKKWFVAAVYVMMAVFTIAYKDAIGDWIRSGGTAELPYAVALATLVALVPGIPYGIVGGMMGAKYGPLLGGAVNVISSSAAAVVMFALARYLFSERGRMFLEKYKHLRRFTLLFEKNAFFSVLLARLFPVVPAAAVNVYAAVSRISAASYIAATVLGKIPIMLLFAVSGDRLLDDPGQLPVLFFAYALFIGAVYGVYRAFGPRRAD